MSLLETMLYQSMILSSDVQGSLNVLLDSLPVETEGIVPDHDVGASASSSSAPATFNGNGTMSKDFGGTATASIPLVSSENGGSFLPPDDAALASPLQQWAVMRAQLGQQQAMLSAQSTTILTLRQQYASVSIAARDATLQLQLAEAKAQRQGDAVRGLVEGLLHQLTVVNEQLHAATTTSAFHYASAKANAMSSHHPVAIGGGSSPISVMAAHHHGTMLRGAAQQAIASVSFAPGSPAGAVYPNIAMTTSASASPSAGSLAAGYKSGGAGSAGVASATPQNPVVFASSAIVLSLVDFLGVIASALGPDSSTETSRLSAMLVEAHTKIHMTMAATAARESEIESELVSFAAATVAARKALQARVESQASEIQRLKHQVIKLDQTVIGYERDIRFAQSQDSYLRAKLQEQESQLDGKHVDAERQAAESALHSLDALNDGVSQRSTLLADIERYKSEQLRTELMMAHLFSGALGDDIARRAREAQERAAAHAAYAAAAGEGGAMVDDGSSQEQATAIDALNRRVHWRETEMEIQALRKSAISLQEDLDAHRQRLGHFEIVAEAAQHCLEDHLDVLPASLRDHFPQFRSRKRDRVNEDRIALEKALSRVNELSAELQRSRSSCDFTWGHQANELSELVSATHDDLANCTKRAADAHQRRKLHRSMDEELDSSAGGGVGHNRRKSGAPSRNLSRASSLRRASSSGMSALDAAILRLQSATATTQGGDAGFPKTNATAMATHAGESSGEADLRPTLLAMPAAFERSHSELLDFFRYVVSQQYACQLQQLKAEESIEQQQRALEEKATRIHSLEQQLETQSSHLSDAKEKLFALQSSLMSEGHSASAAANLTRQSSLVRAKMLAGGSRRGSLRGQALLSGGGESHETLVAAGDAVDEKQGSGGNTATSNLVAVGVETPKAAGTSPSIIVADADARPVSVAATPKSSNKSATVTNRRQQQASVPTSSTTVPSKVGAAGIKTRRASKSTANGKGGTPATPSSAARKVAKVTRANAQSTAKTAPPSASNSNGAHGLPILEGHDVVNSDSDNEPSSASDEGVDEEVDEGDDANATPMMLGDIRGDLSVAPWAPGNGSPPHGLSASTTTWTADEAATTPSIGVLTSKPGAASCASTGLTPFPAVLSGGGRVRGGSFSFLAADSATAAEGRGDAKPSRRQSVVILKPSVTDAAVDCMDLEKSSPLVARGGGSRIASCSSAGTQTTAGQSKPQTTSSVESKGTMTEGCDLLGGDVHGGWPRAPFPSTSSVVDPRTLSMLLAANATALKAPTPNSFAAADQRRGSVLSHPHQHDAALPLRTWIPRTVCPKCGTSLERLVECTVASTMTGSDAPPAVTDGQRAAGRSATLTVVETASAQVACQTPPAAPRLLALNGGIPSHATTSDAREDVWWGNTATPEDPLGAEDMIQGDATLLQAALDTAAALGVKRRDHRWHHSGCAEEGPRSSYFEAQDIRRQVKQCVSHEVRQVHRGVRAARETGAHLAAAQTIVAAFERFTNELRRQRQDEAAQIRDVNAVSAAPSIMGLHGGVMMDGVGLSSSSPGVPDVSPIRRPMPQPQQHWNRKTYYHDDDDDVHRHHRHLAPSEAATLRGGDGPLSSLSHHAPGMSSARSLLSTDSSTLSERASLPELLTTMQHWRSDTSAGGGGLLGVGTSAPPHPRGSLPAACAPPATQGSNVISRPLSSASKGPPTGTRQQRPPSSRDARMPFPKAQPLVVGVVSRPSSSSTHIPSSLSHPPPSGPIGSRPSSTAGGARAAAFSSLSDTNVATSSIVPQLVVTGSGVIGTLSTVAATSPSVW